MTKRDLGLELVRVGMKILTSEWGLKGVPKKDDTEIKEFLGLWERFQRTQECNWCQTETEEEDGYCPRCKDHNPKKENVFRSSLREKGDGV